MDILYAAVVLFVYGMLFFYLGMGLMIGIEMIGKGIKYIKRSLVR